MKTRKTFIKEVVDAILSDPDQQVRSQFYLPPNTTITDELPKHSSSRIIENSISKLAESIVSKYPESDFANWWSEKKKL